MGYKIMIDENTSECPACGYRWDTNFGTVDLAFNEKERNAPRVVPNVKN